MNHVRAITVTGQEVEISHEEIQRIMRSMTPTRHVDNFHQNVEKRNTHYHLNASENIREIAERNGFTDLTGTEEEYKKLLARMMDAEDELGDLIVEIVEERIAAHHKEIYSE